MAQLSDVEIPARSIDRFGPLVGEEALERSRRAAEALRSTLTGRVLWNVNSTSVGGGVAEMLRPLLAYTRGASIDVRWTVIGGDEDFFRITKRLHHALHGANGDGSELGAVERAAYERTLRQQACDLSGRIAPGDVVVLHDPQTAGLAPTLSRLGVHVIWRCHIGTEVVNEYSEAGWKFLAPYLENVEAHVFSRPDYVPAQCAGARIAIIQPSIDAFSAKNQGLTPEATHAILVQAGIVDGPAPRAVPGFERGDGSPGRVERGADLCRLGRATAFDVPLVVQVSRWDPLKDHAGVMEGFARWIHSDPSQRAHLVLAGPNVHAVADDPEGARVYNDVQRRWQGLDRAIRSRVHLAMLPMLDIEENAAIVNALQRHASVVVQKSRCEGFGLTVTEAMWKARPVVASAVGGIKDQIDDGVHGLLVRDPCNLDEFAAALRRIFGSPALARRLGEAARERVRERFLGLDHLVRYAELIEELLGLRRRRRPRPRAGPCTGLRQPGRRSGCPGS